MNLLEFLLILKGQNSFRDLPLPPQPDFLYTSELKAAFNSQLSFPPSCVSLCNSFRP